MYHHQLLNYYEELMSMCVQERDGYTLPPISHRFSLVSFASLLARLSNLTLGKTHTRRHTVNHLRSLLLL